MAEIKASEVKKELQKFASPEKAKILQRFFKTGPGEYGEGDIFLGLRVEEVRAVAKKFPNLDFDELQILLDSKIHEHRLVALLILIIKFESGDKKIVDFYLANTKNINNWDLVDLSADKILGAYLINKDKSVLFKLVKSENLWERRISVLATFHFIKNNEFDNALKIAELLLKDKHDLIHKAVGWMLREVGKRDQVIEEKFLRKHYQKMPRTMLRYAIERFDDKKRKFYLA